MRHVRNAGNGSSGSASSSSSSYLGKKTIVNCNEFVTLRAYASTSAPTVTKVAKGQKVDAYYYNGTFCRCFYNGLEGYILSKYLGGSGGSGKSRGTGGSFLRRGGCFAADPRFLPAGGPGRQRGTIL